MDEAERERYYDEEVAPMLLAMAKACQERGLSFVALVEWAPGDLGQTVALSKTAGAAIRMADLAGRSKGNIDAFMIAAGKSDLASRGHGSIALAMMGFPADPPPA